MRKIDDGEKKKERKRKKEKEKKITTEIVATNVVASRPPNGDRQQRRPLVPITCHMVIIGFKNQTRLESSSAKLSRTELT